LTLDPDRLLFLVEMRTSPLRPSKRTNRVAISIAIFMMAVGCSGSIVGFHDATLRDESGSVNAAGAVILLVGLLLIAAGVMLLLFALNIWQIQLWSGRLVLAACLVAAISAAAFVIAESRSLEKDNWVTGIATAIFGLAIASFIFLQSRTRATLGKVGVFLVGLLATAFGVFQFWYAQQYVPTHKPPALSLSAVLEPAGERGSRALYKATITVKNTGSVKVIAFTGTFFVSGVNYKPPAGHALRKILNPLIKPPGADPYLLRFSRDYVETKFTPVEAGKLFPDNRYFEPGDELTREYVVAVPKGKYDLLSLRTNAVVAKGVLRLGPSPISSGLAPPKRIAVFVDYRIIDDSWIHDIVSGREHFIQIVWDYGKNGSLSGYYQPAVWLFSRHQPPMQFTLKAGTGIGLATTWADYELPILGASKRDRSKRHRGKRHGSDGDRSKGARHVQISFVG
jgi:hypothetical protein